VRCRIDQNIPANIIKFVRGFSDCVGPYQHHQFEGVTSP
jgi:hypothetical protein